ncbi:NADPH oxidase organizer 1a [Syngnathoides biaculeatus]|uniref:NADPH oxidase organizer 1a n=1 Tax=Syngnathoides biaculeatus TaxID=300417 RepID=UPI002ADD7D5C|nr:NADPH oxidase organizer 1a [Syngnathoides biaculeatus]
MQRRASPASHCQTLSARVPTSPLPHFGPVMSQRYPISIRVTGVMEKDKKKMYIASVLWSDEDEIVVYRTLEDFKKMHKLLKKAFPGGKKSERIVPKFHVGKKSKAAQKNGTGKSLNYLNALQKYCNRLLSCDPQVNQSVHLIQFLHPKNEELQPEYARNGIIITPPESQAQQQQILSQGANVTQPFSTETYRCVAPYETKDTKNKPFKIALNEKVDVLIKDKAGWWLVENEDKCLAWFPAPYLERTDDEPEEDDIDGLPERGLFYTVTKSYKATNDDEMTVSVGNSVEVLQKSENGWWLIRYQGKAGYIPSMYLKPPSHGRVAGGQRQRRTHTLLAPSNLAAQSQMMSRSQENLQQPNLARPTSPNLLRPQSKQFSKSTEVLSPPAPAADTLPRPGRAPSPAPGRAPSPAPGLAPSPKPGRAPSPDPGRAPSPNTKHAAPPNASYVPTPIITVENDMDTDLPSSPTGDSEEEFTSDSEFSSDEFSSSSASTSVTLSMSTDDYRLRHSRTPPPPGRNNLNPERALGGKMTPAVSDPVLFKSVSAPKVPPRPRTKEILNRCTTITRKNANRSPSPTQTPIQSH